VLINEINSNHEARTPEALARNVVLIQELDSNVAKVWRKLLLPCFLFLAADGLCRVMPRTGVNCMRHNFDMRHICACTQVLEMYKALTDSLTELGEEELKTEDNAEAGAMQ